MSIGTAPGNIIIEPHRWHCPCVPCRMKLAQHLRRKCGVLERPLGRVWTPPATSDGRA